MFLQHASDGFIHLYGYIQMSCLSSVSRAQLCVSMSVCDFVPPREVRNCGSHADSMCGICIYACLIWRLALIAPRVHWGQFEISLYIYRYDCIYTDMIVHILI